MLEGHFSCFSLNIGWSWLFGPPWSRNQVLTHYHLWLHIPKWIRHWTLKGVIILTFLLLFSPFYPSLAPLGHLGHQFSENWHKEKLQSPIGYCASESPPSPPNLRQFSMWSHFSIKTICQGPFGNPSFQRLQGLINSFISLSFLPQPSNLHPNEPSPLLKEQASSIPHSILGKGFSGSLLTYPLTSTL